MPTLPVAATLEPSAVRGRYEAAITALVEKLKADNYVLAVVLYGSLAYDQVWEKSDIDLCIVTQEMRRKETAFTLVEDGIAVHASVTTRSEFKKAIEGAVEGSMWHSTFVRGRLLFTRDETLASLWENRGHFGHRDREIRLLQEVMFPLTALTKAQKWLTVKHDPRYSFFWLLQCLDGVASIETILAGEIPGREAIWQAIRHNPGLVNPIYVELMDGPKTPDAVRAAIERIREYLRERATVIFRPIFEYLAEAGGPRSGREMNHYFQNEMGVSHTALACEWLADEGFIQQVSMPARITEKSRVDVEEIAYYYDGD